MSKPTKDETPSPTCGIIMPMSAADGLTKSHWDDVHTILRSAIAVAGFDARIVSTADEVSIIQKRIVSNLYADPIVVCDVSAGKPNVLFELGLRIAFDKAVVIVKDDKTPYNFDTAPVEHLEYPRDLRHGQVELFKTELAKRVRATFDASQKSDYKSFLQSFGPFTVAKLDQKEVGPVDYRLEQILDHLRVIQNHIPVPITLTPPPHFVRAFAVESDLISEEAMARIMEVFNPVHIRRFEHGKRADVMLRSGLPLDEISATLRGILGNIHFSVSTDPLPDGIAKKAIGQVNLDGWKRP